MDDLVHNHSSHPLVSDNSFTTMALDRMDERPSDVCDAREAHHVAPHPSDLLVVTTARTWLVVSWFHPRTLKGEKGSIERDVHRNRPDGIGEDTDDDVADGDEDGATDVRRHKRRDEREAQIRDQEMQDGANLRLHGDRRRGVHGSHRGRVACLCHDARCAQVAPDQGSRDVSCTLRGTRRTVRVDGDFDWWSGKASWPSHGKLYQAQRGRGRQSAGEQGRSGPRMDPVDACGSVHCKTHLFGRIEERDLPGTLTCALLHGMSVGDLVPLHHQSRCKALPPKKPGFTTCTRPFKVMRLTIASHLVGEYTRELPVHMPSWS